MWSLPLAFAMTCAFFPDKSLGCVSRWGTVPIVRHTDGCHIPSCVVDTGYWLEEALPGEPGLPPPAMLQSLLSEAELLGQGSTACPVQMGMELC